MNQASIKRGLNQIAKSDAQIKQAIKHYGYPKPRIQAAGFETLINTIISQQLSAKAAESISLRVRTCLGDITPESVIKKRASSLRKAGLSERKVTYMKGLAKAIHKGEFDPENLALMSNSEAIQSITKLHGFGEWSAEIYLMFSLGRKDIFPANDLALQIALAKLKDLDAKPTPKFARELVCHWAPWRSAGSLFLWHYYKLSKQTQKDKK